MNQIIAHLDMDSFYASVEEKYNPKLKGQPLAIGSPPEQRGVVSTANYTARKFGIKSAMPTKRALQLCKSLVLKKGDHKLYKEESNKIMNILKQFTNKIEQVSIDEAYLDLTEFAKDLPLKEAARIIKKEILKQTRLTCSIGISNSRHVSKIASDINKPAGTTIVTNNIEFLNPLEINKIPGIGKVAHKKMLDLNIKTIEDLAKKDKFTLLDNFGKHIIKYQNIAKGIDTTGINQDNYKYSKSISKETTFLEDIETKDCQNHIELLANNLYKQLKTKGFKTISIKVKYYDFQTITRDHSLKTTVNNKNEIIKRAKELLRQVPKTKKVRLFGIKLSNLITNFNQQASLEGFI